MCYHGTVVRDGCEFGRERRETTMKMRKYILILAAVLVCLLAVAIVRNDVTIPGVSLGRYTYDHADRCTAGEASIQAEIGKLDVSWVAGHVDVVCYDGDVIRLTETDGRALDDDAVLRRWQDGDTQYVKYAASGFLSGEGLDKRLSVMIPADMMLTQLTIGVVSADVEASVIAVETIGLSTVSGNVRIAVEEAGTISVDTVSGEIDVEAGQLRKLEATSVSGNVRICLPEDRGFAAHLDSVSGDVTGSLPMQMEDDGYYVSGDQRCQISVSSVSGDVRLDKLDN